MNVDFDYDRFDKTLALTSASTVLRLEMSADAPRSLTAIGSADWTERRSICAGRALGHPVYWCVGTEPGTAQVLVRSDDETWEVALTVPVAAVLAAAETDKTNNI